MKLTARKYTRQQINDFRYNTSKHKDIPYLIDNVSAMRILGWRLLLPLSYKCKVHGFGDVIKFQDINFISLDKGKNRWEIK